jgi:two-component system, OmpR family, response regulator
LSRHILIVDDDEETLQLLKAFLSQAGYQISVATNSDEMDQVMAKWSIDLLILDLMLKNQSGLDICQDLRRESAVPILMLTAMSADQDRIKGLELGADDYMIKPYNPDVLLARIKAILRRISRSPSLQHRLQRGTILFAGWKYDLARQELTRKDGLLIVLSNREATLLATFLGAPKVVLSRDELQDKIQDDQTPAPTKGRAPIDVQISRLRQKLVGEPSGSDMIRTVRGEGYMLATDVERE